MRWTDRTFRFDLPVEMFPVVIERLRGAAPRIEEKVRGLPAEILTRRGGDSWSIQEHIGHLLDLDELHIGRLADYLANAEVLRAADMENRKTWQADHNLKAAEYLVQQFRRERESFVERLETWADPSQSAMHPRLSQPMRVIDMAFFVAEHDDHHLARMTELARKFS
ncbi:MAG: hypothetical protein QOH06_4184 [Acidobacteriota bacterium]|jgi:uncharacterized damage-inducible protein DinB|nr:hypothetical protein [Acidobacteriota bacterium]